METRFETSFGGFSQREAELQKCAAVRRRWPAAPRVGYHPTLASVRYLKVHTLQYVRYVPGKGRYIRRQEYVLLYGETSPLELYLTEVFGT